ncbi:MAG: tyrosine--tRNA ligase [Candidatus Pacebacteria bacterium]|nr:tyrosine--tRNA ligase [Candidatus Paceibacterota bacterium]
MKLSEELKERGFIHQFSGESLENILDGEKRTFYLGADPTADSLTIGNLAVYMLVRHIADAGHTPILLFGGGTGLLGDPKEASERELSDSEEVARRADKIRKQVESFIGTEVTTVNNADWLTKLNLIDFMRGIGKHFTINQMIKKEIVARRLKDESPISYTEFAYAPLQGYDFMHLYKEYNCTLQIGGSDQWGNIISGVELTRKKEGAEVFAIAVPLITDSSGVKFGKSEGNAIWLDATMTSPYSFYQFWLNVTDEDVVERLKIFTLLTLDEIVHAMSEHSKDKSARGAQRLLAVEVTAFVHGKKAAIAAAAVSDVLFGGKGIDELGDAEIEMLKTEAPTSTVRDGVALVDVLVESELVASKTEARTMVGGGAVSISGVKILDTDFNITSGDFVDGIAILRKGKKQLVVLILA